MFSKRHIFVTPIMHEEFQGLRIKPNPPTDGLIQSHPALSPWPLGSCDLCRGFPVRSILRLLAKTFGVAHVSTTLNELDRFSEQMELIARNGLPS